MPSSSMFVLYTQMCASTCTCTWALFILTTEQKCIIIIITISIKTNTHMIVRYRRRLAIQELRRQIYINNIIRHIRCGHTHKTPVCVLICACVCVFTCLISDAIRDSCQQHRSFSSLKILLCGRHIRLLCSILLLIVSKCSKTQSNYNIKSLCKTHIQTIPKYYSIANEKSRDIHSLSTKCIEIFAHSTPHQS